MPKIITLMTLSTKYMAKNLVSIRLQSSRAYTMVELALVMLIIALIYSSIAPVYMHIVEEKKTDAAVDKIELMELDITEFYKDNGRFPDSLEEIYNPVPLDPWGNPYQYLNILDNPAKGKGKLRKDKNLVPINSDFDLYSMGPDGESASPLTASISKDDIVRGRNGDFVGLATDY